MIKSPQDTTKARKSKKLHEELRKRGLYTKEYTEFLGQFDTPEKQTKLHQNLSERGLVTIDAEEFSSKYFQPFTPAEEAPEESSKAQTLEVPDPEPVEVEKSTVEDLTESYLGTGGVGAAAGQEGFSREFFGEGINPINPRLNRFLQEVSQTPPDPFGDAEGSGIFPGIIALQSTREALIERGETEDSQAVKDVDRDLALLQRERQQRLEPLQKTKEDLIAERKELTRMRTARASGRFPKGGGEDEKARLQEIDSELERIGSQLSELGVKPEFRLVSEVVENPAVLWDATVNFTKGLTVLGADIMKTPDFNMSQFQDAALWVGSKITGRSMQEQRDHEQGLGMLWVENLEDQPLYKIANRAEKVVEEAAEAAKITDPVARAELQNSFWFTDLPAGVGSMASYIGLAYLTRGASASMPTQTASAGRAKRLWNYISNMGKEVAQSPATYAASSGAATRAYEEARAPGFLKPEVSEQEALRVARRSLPSGAIQVANVIRLGGKLDKALGGKMSRNFMNYILEGGKSGVNEFAVEGMGRVAYNAAVKSVWDENRDLMDNVWEQSRVGGAAGFLSGFLIGALGGRRAPGGSVRQAEQPYNEFKEWLDAFEGAENFVTPVEISLDPTTGTQGQEQAETTETTPPEAPPETTPEDQAEAEPTPEGAPPVEGEPVTQQSLEENVQRLKDERAGLRGEDGTVPESNMPRFRELNQEINQAIDMASRGVIPEGSRITIRTRPQTAEADPQVLTGDEATLAEQTIERIITRGKRNNQPVEGIIQSITQRYAFHANEMEALNRYVRDRVNDAIPEVGNNKAPFPQWRKGQGHVEAKAQTTPTEAAPETTPDLGREVPVAQGTAPESGLVVSALDADGNMYIGEPGEIHAGLLDTHDLDVETTEMGFTDPTGKFLTRNEASEFMAATRPDFEPEVKGMVMGDELPATEVTETTPETTPEDQIEAYPIREEDGRFFVPQRNAPGETIHETRADAQEQAEFNRRQDESQRRREEQAEESERSRQAEQAPLREFMSQLPARQAGKAQLTLGQPIGYQGDVYTRRELVEKLIDEGYRVEKNRLVSPDGSFLDATDITQTGINYARYLSDQTQAVDNSTIEKSQEDASVDFPNTKVVDADGKPRVVYQGRSTKGLDTLFRNGEGWFSSRRGVAVQFADAEKHVELFDTPEQYQTIPNEELKGQVYPAFINIENPMMVPLEETRWNRDVEREKIAQAKAAGHDGLIITEGADATHRDFVVFDSSQILQYEEVGSPNHIEPGSPRNDVNAPPEKGGTSAQGTHTPPPEMPTDPGSRPDKPPVRPRRSTEKEPVYSQHFNVTSRSTSESVHIKTDNMAAAILLEEAGAQYNAETREWTIESGRAEDFQEALEEAQQMSEDGFRSMFTSPQPVGASYDGAAKFIGKTRKGETRTGRGIIKRIEKDNEGLKIGVRSIVDFVNGLVGVDLRVAKSQTTKKHPAHFKSMTDIVRSRIAAWQYNFHEAGHKLSQTLRDQDASWWNSVKKQLVDLTNGEGENASAKTAEEGFAEWVRLFIVNPTKLPAELTTSIEQKLESMQPRVMKGLRDAHRAWDAHKSRPVIAQFSQYSYDDGAPKGVVSRIAETFDRFLFEAMSIEHALTRVERKTFRAISRLSQEHWNNVADAFDHSPVAGIQALYKAGKEKVAALRRAREFEKSYQDSPADSKIALQAYLRAPIDAHFAIHGDPHIKREGIRIRWWSEKSFNEMFPPEIKQALEDAGYQIPDVTAEFGHDIFVSDKSISQIKSEVGKDKWDEFQWYGFMRESVNRKENKGHDYQGISDGLTPEVLKKEIRRIEKENPHFADRFDDVNQYFDQLALISYISGEKTVIEGKDAEGNIVPGDLLRIKDGIDSYWPMPRRMRQGSTGSSATGTRGEPDSGIRNAHGSEQPVVTLDEAIESRTRRALEAYYWNNVMLSVRNLAKQMRNDSSLPLDARSAAQGLMVPLKLDKELAATMRPEEGQEIIAEYLNELLVREKIETALADQNLSEEQIQELVEATISGDFQFIPEQFRLTDEEKIDPQSIEVSWNGKQVWRATRPAITKIVAPFENGSRQFYEVGDPILFDMFTHSKNPGEFTNMVFEIVNPMVQAWKRPLTHNVIFSAWQVISRDIPSSALMGQGWRAFVPGFYAAEGALNRITGKNVEAIESGALLTKAFSEITSDAHATRVERFMEVLKEGILIPGYGDLSTGAKLRQIPGQVNATILKPVELFLYLTGQRGLSIAMESLPREGAYIEMVNQGKSPAAAQEQYDKLIGNFGSYPGNAKALAAYRMAGFINPGVQVFYQHYQKLFNHNPREAVKSWTVKIPWIAASWAAFAAANWLYTGDEEKERMRERRDNDRMRYMNWFGYGRVPFDYGLTGLAQSYGWNVVEGMLLEDEVGGDAMARAILERAIDLPGHPATFLPPLAKTSIELQANYSFFFGDNIVPPWMQDIYEFNPEFQAYDSTPDFYKSLGETFGISPIKIQYFTRNALTNQLDEAIQAIDTFSKGHTFDELADIPFLGRTFEREPRGYRSQSVLSLDELDRQYQAVSQRYNRLMESDTLDDEEIDELIDQMSDLQEAHAFAKEIQRFQKQITAERRRDNPDQEFIRESERIMTEIAREYFEGLEPVEPQPREGAPEPVDEDEQPVTPVSDRQAPDQSVSSQLDPDSRDLVQPTDSSAEKGVIPLPDFIEKEIDSPTARDFQRLNSDTTYMFGAKGTGNYTDKDGSPVKTKLNEIDCSGAVCRVLNEKGQSFDPNYTSAATLKNKADIRGIDIEDAQDGDLITMNTEGRYTDHVGFLVVDEPTGQKFIAESTGSYGRAVIVPFQERIDNLEEVDEDFSFEIVRYNQ